MTKKTLKIINRIAAIIYLLLLVLYIAGFDWAEKPTIICMVLGLLWCQFRDRQCKNKND